MEPPGISLSVFEPLPVNATPNLLYTIARPKTYTHKINAVGGYWSLDFAVEPTTDEMDDWISEGLSRHIEVYNDGLVKIWEGFVDRVDAAYGNLTVTRGPLLETANRVKAVYAGVDISVIPPTTGVQMETADADDPDSQARYGVIPKILTPGGVSTTDAEQIRDTYLEEHKLPATTQRLVTSAARKSLTIRCKGYVHWLMYPYNMTLVVGTTDSASKITDALDGSIITVPEGGTDPNPNASWLTWDVSGIETPAAAIAVFKYEYENPTAWEVIEDVTARGDGNHARWLSGVYGDRLFRYRAAPTIVEYTMMLADPSQKVTTEAGTDVPYWDVAAGEWLLFTDFLPGMAVPSSLREDPRAMFVEEVTYTAPRTLMLKGGKLDTLPQKLASLGLGGIGA